MDSNDEKTALVIGPGGLRGAYNAGATVQLLREYGNEWVDRVYASSVGVYMAAFFAAGQPDPIEHVWRNHVHGNQLVDVKKMLVGRNWLDLEYLVHILRKEGEDSWMNTRKAMDSSVGLTMTLTNASTGEAKYVNPNRENIFSVMTASCAVPFMHPPVKVRRREYIDGSIADYLPVEQVIADSNDRIVVIDGNHLNEDSGSDVMRYISLFYDSSVAENLCGYSQQKQNKLDMLRECSQIKTIRPDDSLPMTSFMDTDKARINATFDRGFADAKSLDIKW